MLEPWAAPSRKKPQRGHEPLENLANSWGSRLRGRSPPLREEVGRQEGPPLSPASAPLRLSTARSPRSASRQCAPVITQSSPGSSRCVCAILCRPTRGLASRLPPGPSPAVPGPRLPRPAGSPRLEHHGRYRDVTRGRPGGAQAGRRLGSGEAVEALTLGARVGPLGLLFILSSCALHSVGGTHLGAHGIFFLPLCGNKRNAWKSWGQEGRGKLDLEEYFYDGGQALGG